MQIDDHLRRGTSPEEARQQALLCLGGAELARQAYRERSILCWIENRVQDTRHGLRGLQKSPGYSFIVVLSLALGIGATTAVFSVIYSILICGRR